ncbi:MAG: hypothetical protein QXO51_04655 [Halobacteria archaeon]
MATPVRLSTLLLLLAALPVASADVPSLVSLSGRLTDTGGSPVAGPVSLGFTIYNNSTTGTALWAETQSSVALSNGVFSVLLGSVTPLNLSFSESYWVAMTVNGDLQNPRLRLAASPYAVAANRSQNATWADRAARADNLSCVGCVNGTHLAAGTATTLAQGWDLCAPGVNATFVLVTPSQGFAEVRLHLFGERSLAYERADAYERATGVGNVSSTTASGGVESGGTITTSEVAAGANPTGPSGAGGGFGVATHTHTIDKLFQHNHSLTSQTTELNRTNASVNRTGGLPADAALFVDGVNRTGDLAWTTRSPALPRDLMLNQTVTAWTSAAGVHWFDVQCTAPGAVRFVVSAR